MKKSSLDKMLSQKNIKSNDKSKGKMEGHNMTRSISEKILFLSHSPKNNHDHDMKSPRSNRFLINISVFGSAGPLRFIVREDDIAATVIETALRQYAHQGRLPVLGTDINPFFLYTVDNGFNALKSSESIGSCGFRNFALGKQMTESIPHSTVDHRKASGWRTCFQKVYI